MNKPSPSRRQILRSGLTAAGVLAASVPDWAIPALAQGETEIAFTDIPANFSTKRPNSLTQTLDIRTIDGLFTPADKFFALQHHDQPEVDPAGYRLQVTGLVDNPTTLSIEDLRSLPSTEIAAGYECSGNSPRATQALVSCGLWKGVRLRDLLDGIGVSSRAREVVFFGLDRGVEDVDFRGTVYKLEQQFGRSISIEKAMTPEPLLAYELNGAPLTRPQGFPLRVIMPGWYGVSNVKWLGEIQLQQDRYVGKYQARWYRTIRGEIVDDDIAGQIDAMLAAPNPKEGDRPEPDASQVQWVETEVSRIQLKSVVARVTKRGNGFQILGFVLNDGTPLRSVEVKIDNGPWQRATLSPDNTQYSWKLFTLDWMGAKPGEHMIVSRATDIHGYVQPEEKDLRLKRSFLEHNAQMPRTVKIG